MQPKGMTPSLLIFQISLVLGEKQQSGDCELILTFCASPGLLRLQLPSRHALGRGAQVCSGLSQNKASVHRPRAPLGSAWLWEMMRGVRVSVEGAG